LIFYKKSSGKPTLSYEEAVEEALCFGWIDSKAKPIDEEKHMQFFTRRKPKSGWSLINKKRVQALIDKKLMATAGLEAIETAKQNGAWTLLDEVEAMTIPPDLSAAFKKAAKAEEFFMQLSNSTKKMMLQWIVFAKRPETRQKRINEIVTLAAKKTKPKQF
jgi:uncharacterized protein YdeI (YjbR/CyaY-like superfamily)